MLASSGDGVVRLHWSTPGSCPSGPFDVQRAASLEGPWEDVGQPLNLAQYKDVGLPDGLMLWYRVVASCPANRLTSQSVPATPSVTPYTWDFGRAVEGTSGTSEGWTAAAHSTVSSAARSDQPATKPKKRDKSASTGYLVVTGKANHTAALSPAGLELETRSYNQLTVDALEPAPPALKMAWKPLGSSRWSPSRTCTFRAIPGNESECRIDILGSDWTGTVDQIRISFPKSSSVSLDRVGFAGPRAARPLVGAIRWDGWYPGNGQFVDPSLYTDFDSRQPSLGWLDETGSDPSGLAQHRLDLMAEMQQARAGGIDFWAFDWYPAIPDSRSTGTGVSPFAGALSDYQSYLAGLEKGTQPLVDFAVTLTVPDVDRPDRKAGQLSTLPFWNSTLVPQLVRMFRQPAYVKVGGNRPLVYWQSLFLLGSDSGFGSCPNGCWQLALNDLIKQTVASGLGPPYMVDADSYASAAAKYGMDGLTSYGPDVFLATHYRNEGHQAWNKGPASPAAVDVAVANQSAPDGHGGLLAVQPGLTATLDHRPENAGTEFASRRHPYAPTFWYDYPTYTQWENHVRGIYDQVQLYPGRSSDPGVILMYSWNETSEGGGIQPSSTFGSYLLDAVAAARSGNQSALAWNTWDDSNLGITYKGGWRAEGPSPTAGPGGVEPPGPSTTVPGAYNDSEHIDVNTAPGATATIRLAPSVGVQVLATTGPDRGVESVSIDGTRRNVDLYSPSYRSQAIVFQQGGLPPAAHLLEISSTGLENPRSTGRAIDFDAISALMAQVGTTSPGPLPPNRLSVRGLAGEVQLTWDPAIGADGYRVERSAGPGGPWQTVGQVAASTQPITWSDLSVGGATLQLWYYRVESLAGRQAGPASDVQPAITVPDLAAGGQPSSGSGAGGVWSQVIFAVASATMVDEIDFTGAAPDRPVSVQVTKDGGRSWVTVYQNRGPVGLGGRRWLSFPPVVADGVRLSGATGPVHFGVYLR